MNNMMQTPLSKKVQELVAQREESNYTPYTQESYVKYVDDVDAIGEKVSDVQFLFYKAKTVTIGKPGVIKYEDADCMPDAKMLRFELNIATAVEQAMKEGMMEHIPEDLKDKFYKTLSHYINAKDLKEKNVVDNKFSYYANVFQKVLQDLDKAGLFVKNPKAEAKVEDKAEAKAKAKA
jgi:hypothetical protein